MSNPAEPADSAPIDQEAEPYDMSSLDATTASHIRGLRAENAKYRTRAKEANAQVMTLTVANAVTDALYAAGANVRLTRALLATEGADAVGRLDPSAADFKEQVMTLVTETVAQNPELKARQGPPRSGLEFNGGQPASDQLSHAEVQALYAAGRHEEIEQHRKAGRLSALLRGGF